jgi:hypothetical protein
MKDEDYTPFFAIYSPFSPLPSTFYLLHNI